MKFLSFHIRPGFLSFSFYQVFSLIIVCIAPSSADAQTIYLIPDSICIKGTVKTKRNVILKELDINPGDTIPLGQLAYRLSINEKRLESIGLFTRAKINIKNWDTESGHGDIEILVQENWYIYPILILELADRNFNVWANEQHFALNRLNYGLTLQHINFTGNKDKLKLKWQRGYTHKYEASYDYPYLHDRWGFSANVLYTENKEIAYRTLGNKPQFYRSDDERILFRQYRAGIQLQHRTNSLLFQTLKMEYVAAFADTAISTVLNPAYFGDGINHLKVFSLEYYLKWDKTVYPLYPLDGYKVEFSIRKDGLGILRQVSFTSLSVSVDYRTKVNKRITLSNRVKGKINLENNPLPYFLNTAIGYKTDNIIGYQLYVQDGRDFLLSNNAVRIRVMDSDYQAGNYFPKQFRVVNIKLFARFSVDFGYARDPVYVAGNPYTNRWEYGYGPGLDLILYNNFTFSTEYGITRFGEKGLFYQFKFNF